MIRWVMVAALLAVIACNASPKPSCDPATGPSKEWAYAEYVAQGGATIENTTGLWIFDRTTYKGLSDLVHDPGDPMPMSFLGTVWKCTLDRDPRALAKLMLAHVEDESHHELHHDGMATPVFTREEVVIGPDGTVGETKKLASYKRDTRAK